MQQFGTDRGCHRTKTVSTAGRSAAPPPARLTTLQDEDRSSRDEKEEGGSEGSGEDGCKLTDLSRDPSSLSKASDRPKPNGIHTSMSKAATMSFRKDGDTSVWKSIGGVPRDPKSRARSREYLKQCVVASSELEKLRTPQVFTGDHVSHLTRRAEPSSSPTSLVEYRPLITDSREWLITRKSTSFRTRSVTRTTSQSIT